MSDVRGVLQRVLNISAQESRLGMRWGNRFRIATDLSEELYQSGLASKEYVDAILANYTEQEIITILAAARLEGVWTPE